MNPKLVEPNVYGFLYQTLQKCHEFKNYYFFIFFNTTIFIIFVLVLSTILYYSRKQKLTPEEEYEKQLREQNYILSKIREYKLEQTRKTSMITDLPFTYNPDAGLDVHF